jgi:hypothetical protein
MEGTVQHSSTWDDQGNLPKIIDFPEIKQGEAVDSIIKNMLKEKNNKTEDNPLYEKNPKVRKQLEKILEKSNKKKLDVLDVFGRAVDSKLEKKCINVFILREFEDTGIDGDQAGLAQIGDRNIFIDESAFEDNGRILAHELGHNLSLKHPKPKINGNLMSDGLDLTETQCQQVCIHLTKEDLRSAIIPRNEAKRRYEAKNEEKKRKQSRKQLMEKRKELQDKAKDLKTEAEEMHDKANTIRKEPGNNPEYKDAIDKLAEAEKALHRERLMKRYRNSKSRTRQMKKRLRDAERARDRGQDEKASKAELDAEILEGLIESGEKTSPKGITNAKKKLEAAKEKVTEAKNKVESEAKTIEDKAKQLERDAEKLEKEAENLNTI